MKTKILSLIVAMLLAGVAYGSGQEPRKYTATDTGAKYETGLDGDAVAGGAVSDSINMTQKYWASTIDWQVTITAGTTTTVVATCEESIDSSTWVKIMGCTNAIDATCTEKSMSYDVTTTPGFSLTIAHITAQYIRCTFTGTGDGTISASATAGAF